VSIYVLHFTLFVWNFFLLSNEISFLRIDSSLLLLLFSRKFNDTPSLSFNSSLFCLHSHQASTNGSCDELISELH
jgi:hypothetical protein